MGEKIGGGGGLRAARFELSRTVLRLQARLGKPLARCGQRGAAIRQLRGGILKLALHGGELRAALVERVGGRGKLGLLGRQLVL